MIYFIINFPKKSIITNAHIKPAYQKKKILENLEH